MLDPEVHRASSQEEKNISTLDPHEHKLETDKDGQKFISIFVASETRVS